MMPSPLVATLVAITPKGTVEALGLIAACLGFVATIWKLGLKPLIAFGVKVGDGVEFVRAQMERNGGSTQADALARIEVTTTETAERLSAIEQRVAVVETNTEVHATRLDHGAERMDEIRGALTTLASDVAALRTKPTPSLPPKEDHSA